MSFYSELAQRLTSQRDPRWIVGPLIAIVTAWIVGKSIAGMKFGLVMMLLGAVVFLLVFFRRHSIVFLFPLVMALPNIGLDIPGPWAMLDRFFGPDRLVDLKYGGGKTRTRRAGIEHRKTATERPSPGAARRPLPAGEVSQG